MKHQGLSNSFISILALISLAFSVSSFAQSDLKLPDQNRNVPLAITSDDALGTNDENIGLKAGDKVGNFSVADQNGNKITSGQLLQDAPIMVMFYRGGWCPFCNVQIRQLTLAYPEFEKRGVKIAAISVDSAEGAALASKTYDIPFAVLSDSDLSAHTAFNVVMDIDAATFERYKEYGLDLEKWSGKDHHKIAFSSIFFLDKSGQVKWSHAQRDYRTRPSPEQLLSVIDTIQKD